MSTAPTYVLPDGETVDADETQLICDPNAYGTCPCIGEGGAYECICHANEAGTACASCNAVLVRIETNSGDRVEVAR
jgi:hypothetical protein